MIYYVIETQNQDTSKTTKQFNPRIIYRHVLNVYCLFRCDSYISNRKKVTVCTRFDKMLSLRDCKNTSNPFDIKELILSGFTNSFCSISFNAHLWNQTKNIISFVTTQLSNT